MVDSDRLSSLRLAQSKIVERLDDPATPGYSIAPLTNQLRLVEKEMAKLTEDKGDEGLPDPDSFGLVTALSFEHWLRGQIPARRTPASEFSARQAEIFGSWQDAGFELSARSGSADEWVEENRARLFACLGIDDG